MTSSASLEDSALMAENRKRTAELGMWIFLASEALLFGGLFLAYFVYRYSFPQAFAAGVRENDLILGTINTIILMLSALFMTLGILAAENDNKKSSLSCLIMTAFLGLTFLGIKSLEYSHKFQHHLYPGGVFMPEKNWPVGERIFFGLYFVMTGVHALHLLVGIGILAWLIFVLSHKPRVRDSTVWLYTFGLYWHYIDLIWIFLFPSLYLLGRFG